MSRVGDIAQKVRSKNAGPFWLTIDIFCGTAEIFTRISNGLKNDDVAMAFGIAPDVLRRFDIGDLNVVKFSLPRPQIQGSVADRDLHGASFAAILSEIKLGM